MGSRIIGGLLGQPAVRARPAQSWARRAGAAMVVAAACLLALCLPAAPADAHSVLVSSTPVESSVLSTVPTVVRLEFDQPVLPDFAQAALTAGDRETVDVVPVVDGSVVTIELPSIESVDRSRSSELWQVSYRLVSADDGHPAGGVVSFTVGVGATSAGASDAGHAAGDRSSTGPSSVWWWIGGAAVVVALLGTLALSQRARRRVLRSPVGTRTTRPGRPVAAMRSDTL